MFPAVVQVCGRQVKFALDDPEDEVQRHILNGDFYERDQLEFHRTLIPRDGRVLDVGGNIGNHSVYYDVVCAAASVISIEPNRRAWNLFHKTIDWNHLRIELFEGVAAGAEDGWATLKEPEEQYHNLGGTSSEYHCEEIEGSVPVRTCDNILDSRGVDFVKVDVEGAELSVLEGLQATISSCSPVIAIEVVQSNCSAFFEWCLDNSYRVERTFQMYRGVFNYICLPTF